MYCLNFNSRIAQREHTCVCTRFCAAAHVLRYRIRVPDNKRQGKDRSAAPVGCRRGEGGEGGGGERGENAVGKARGKYWKPRASRPVSPGHFSLLCVSFVRVTSYACTRVLLYVGVRARGRARVVVERRRNGTLRTAQTGAVSLEYLGGGGHILFRRAG